MARNRIHPFHAIQRNRVTVLVQNQNGDGRTKPNLRSIIQNAVYSTRIRMFRQMFGDLRRSIEDECGYPTTESITAQDYRMLDDRDPIAARVNNVWPKECWRTQPTVYEDEDSETVTVFEEAWDGLGKSLRGQSWYADEHGNPVWELLRRADERSGVGRFGAILLGLDDGKELSEPADGLDERGRKAGKAADHELLYARVLDESMITIAQLQTDNKNPRYGLPMSYSVNLTDVVSGGVSLMSATVHWTRIVHLADNLRNSEVFGVPRCQVVYNRLMDLRKLYGPSAEMYYKGAFPGMSLEPANPLLDVEVNVNDLKDMMEEYMNGLQRWIAPDKLSAKMLNPTVVDPTGQISAQIEGICVIIEVPKRIFVGSERGELASSQDAGSWNDRVRARQDNYVTPRVVVPFVDRLIALGVLPEPEEYHVNWPDVEALSDQEKATVAVTRTDAMTKYIQGGVEALLTPMDYLTRELGYDEDEAAEVLQAAEQEATDREEEQAAQQEEQDTMKQELLKEMQDQQPPQAPGEKPPFGQPKQQKEVKAFAEKHGANQ